MGRLRFTALTVIVILVLSSTAFVQKANAVSGDQFNPGRIIDDVVFFSSNTMSASEIQNFLNSKVPVCDTWHAGRDGNNPPFTCLKDYRQDTPNRSAEAGICNGFTAGNKTAAQIIYEVGVSCGVNPQVLIVLLQKEQSLITDTWPWTIQYRSATGYGCPDTAPCDAEYYGFFNQVYAAARQFRYYASNPSSFNYRAGRSNYILYNPNTACDGSNVYIQNQATAGLYNYTPYQPNQSALSNLYGSGDSCGAYGNRNFWRLFNDWFGSTTIGVKPSPLYKSSSSQKIYVISDGKKLLVPSPEILVNYGLHHFSAATVNDSFLSNYATGDTLTNLGKKQYDPSGKLYLFDDGKRYPVSISDCAKQPNGTPIANTTWGLECFNTNTSKTLPNELVDMYTAPDINLPKVVMNNNASWKMENGKKRRIVSPEFVDVLGGWSNARWVKDNNVQQTQGKLLIADNTVVKFSNSNIIYLSINSTLLPIPGPEEFNSLGMNMLPLKSIPASYNTDPLPITTTLTNYVKSTSSGKIYLAAGGKKLDLTGKESNWPTTQAVNLPESFVSKLPLSNKLSVFRSPSGRIFTVINKKLYSFPTLDDFNKLGFESEDITHVSTAVESGLGYGGMHLASGRLYKVSGNDTIYLVKDNKSLIVHSTNYPGLPYDKLINVDSVTASRYPMNGYYTPL
ncbi:MAG: hypothetical protein U0451_04205 [Candidatus Saccharimonadales bacterium]